MRRQKTALVVAILIVTTMIAGLVAAGCGRGGGDGGVTPGEEPVYGGTLTVHSAVDPVGFDDAIRPHYTCFTLKLTNDEVWEGDWAKGHAGGYGSDDSTWYAGGGVNRLEHKVGALAESLEWDPEQKDSITLHLREGVHWQDKEPTNGREVTADDVAFSLQRQYTLDTAYMKTTYPRAAAATEISAVDENTVLIECNPEDFGDVVTMLDYMCIYPRDAVEEFGDMNDWRNSIASGPFTLTDYMPGSSVTFARNPDYWGENPVGPGEGDQVPYLDEVEVMIIPDESTQDAAFRTGETDILTCDWERAQGFLGMPDVEHVRYIDDYAQAAIYMRTDKEDSPYSDVRVRQALYLAIDNEKILEEYYGGEGILLKWPIVPSAEYAGAYVPLEELPESVQELYGYDPEKARELLADAGYPDGFEASIICFNQRAYLDPLSMVVDMWSDVGVDVTIDPKDYSTFTSIIVKRAYEDMLYTWYSGIGTYFKAINYTGTGMYNASYVDDPVLNQGREEMIAAYPDEEKVDDIHAELMPYLLEQVYAIGLPTAYTYRFWWPWVGNYSGEYSLGYYNLWKGLKYVWIDQDLKESMGY